MIVLIRKRGVIGDGVGVGVCGSGGDGAGSGVSVIIGGGGGLKGWTLRSFLRLKMASLRLVPRARKGEDGWGSLRTCRRSVITMVIFSVFEVFSMEHLWEKNSKVLEIRLHLLIRL